MFVRRFAAAVTVASAAFIAPVAHAPSACAASAHHAALIIDTGSQVVRKCVGFDEDSITGKDMLDRADVNVVYSDKYSEAFVCSMLGVGNDQAHCPNNDANQNWSYYEAKSGDAGFPSSYSNVGASRTTVRDGDVEGWTWGRQSPPPYSPASAVCPAAAPAPTTTAPAPAVTTTAGRSGFAAVRSGGTSNGPSTTSPDTTSTTTTTTTASRRLAIHQTNDKSGSPLALAAIGAIVVGLGAASFVISRRRAAGG